MTRQNNRDDVELVEWIRKLLICMLIVKQAIRTGFTISLNGWEYLYCKMSKLCTVERSIQCELVCCAYTSLLFGLLLNGTVIGDEVSRDSQVHQFTSQHFLVHTDLSTEKVRDLIDQLEKTLGTITQYWGQSLPGRIEYYVVDNLSRWSFDQLPSQMSRTLLDKVGGVTWPEVSDEGTTKAIVFCAARTEVAVHEVIHAYCCQTFGRTGPDWYKEGMADLVRLHTEKERSVQCPREFIQFFHSQPLHTAHDIVTAGPFVTPLVEALDRLSFLDKTVESSIAAMPKKWGDVEDEILQRVKESYYRSWALCHFLTHNSNYSKCFRELGQSYIHGTQGNFSKTFALVKEQLEFEFRFFLERLEPGFRVDLCRWNWKKVFRSISRGTQHSTIVRAAAGYQPTGCLLEKGKTYTYHATGKWRTTSDSLQVTAAGNKLGNGCLVGVVLNDYRLTNEFSLGESGTMVATDSGQLYLRCWDQWSGLSDNRGVLFVNLSETEG